MAVAPELPEQDPSSQTERGKLIVLRDRPQSPAAEAYRSVRTSLQLMAREKQAAIVVTSPNAGDGKTYCAVNVASALAVAGKRVLLVGADMRRPALHTVFGLAQGEGLSEFLAEQAEEAPVAETNIGNLRVVQSGQIPPNPSELLGAARMAEGLATWRSAYDHIIFDTTPILGVTDALVLARQVGRALVVVRAGRTTDRQLRRGVEQLRGAGVEVLGVILNGHRSPTEAYESYNYTYTSFTSGR